jgi:hypothetical protein
LGVTLDEIVRNVGIICGRLALDETSAGPCPLHRVRDTDSHPRAAMISSARAPLTG